MRLSWSKWNSGGGCMIYSFDFQTSDDQTFSIHATTEDMVTADISSVEYWALETWEEQESHHALAMVLYNEELSISATLCEYAGQELADLIEKDVREIWAQYD